jgi:hypothetical protein
MSNSKRSTRKTAIKDDTKLLRKKATCGVSEAWDDVLNCLPKKATTFGALVKTVAKKLEGDALYTRRIVGSLRRRGCIAIAKS